MDLRIPSTTSPVRHPAPQRRGRRRRIDQSGGWRLQPGPSGALQSVSSAQNHSSQLQREVQLENPAVSLEETMIAMQKAQIGFQATMQVRNRLVQAYTDVMNMQV